MVHWDFNERVACAFNQRRNETVHSLKRQEGVNTLAAHRLEGAAGIAHAVVCLTAANSVSDPAGQSFDERISALGAITANEIGAARDLSK